MSTTLQEEIPPGQERKPSSWRPSRGQIVVGSLALTLLLIGLVAAFGSPVWQLLSTATIVLALAITALLAIGMLVAGGAISAFWHEEAQSTTWLRRASRLAIAVATVLVILGGVAVVSQLHAATPAITGATGQPLAGGEAESGC